MRAQMALGWSLPIGWIAAPWFLWWAANGLDNVVWFVLHQLYYLPLGCWIGKPFFMPDSEVMFFVLPAGRVLTALFYIAIGGMIFLVRRTWKRKR